MGLLPQIRMSLHAHLAAVSGQQRFTAGVGADGAVQLTGAHLVEEARGHGLALHLSHGAGVAVGQHGLGVARGNGFQPVGDVVQGLFPAHGFEAAFALLAHPFQGCQHAVGAVGAFSVSADLRTQRAVRGWVAGVAGHARDAAVFDGNAQRAGVGAVVRAGAAHDTHGCGRAFVGKGFNGHPCNVPQPARLRARG
jgi:hypothetical protein